MKVIKLDSLLGGYLVASFLCDVNVLHPLYHHFKLRKWYRRPVSELKFSTEHTFQLGGFILRVNCVRRVFMWFWFKNGS